MLAYVLKTFMLPLTALGLTVKLVMILPSTYSWVLLRVKVQLL